MTARQRDHKKRSLRKAKRVLRRLIPYRGNCYFEVQIGPTVIQVLHNGVKGGRGRGHRLKSTGSPAPPWQQRFHVWYDPFWWH